MEKIQVERKNGNSYFNLCNEVMACEICSDFIMMKNLALSIELEQDYRRYKNVVQIDIAITPAVETRKYFSFDGLENILNNILNSNSIEFKKELKKLKGAVKLYFIEGNLFFQLLLFNVADENLYNHLKGIITSEEFNKSQIQSKIQEYFLPRGVKRDLFHFPLSLNQESFTKSIKMKNLNFTEEQLKEMDYILGMGVKKLNLKEFINGKSNSFFKVEKELSQIDIQGRKVEGH